MSELHDNEATLNGKTYWRESSEYVDALEMEVKRLREQIADSFLDAYIAGLQEYAFWKDGTEYVGSCGRTLTQAIDRAKAERFLIVREAEKGKP